MIKKILILVFLSYLWLLSSCANGVKIDEKDFRSVAGFLLPENDEPTGTAEFTAKLTPAKEYGKYEQADSQTAVLKLFNVTEAEMTLNMHLKLTGLINNQYGNVRVTASYTPFDTSSASLVKEVHFDKYNMMVFTANIGITSYDPSAADVTVKLNTAAKNQMGILSFKFEYAQSVYDSAKCTKEYRLFITTGENDIPVVIFGKIRATDPAPAGFEVSGTKNAYTAKYTDLTGYTISKAFSQRLSLDLHYLDPDHPITFTVNNINGKISITDISTPRISAVTGTIDFTLNYEQGSYNPTGDPGSCTLKIEDPSGYYAGLPIEIPLTTLRQIPEVSDIGGSFLTDEDASPWAWRMQYIAKTGIRGLGTPVRTDALANNVSQNTGIDFKSNSDGKNETLGETKKGRACYYDNGDTAGSYKGDVTGSCGWLFSDAITIGAGFDYKLNATIKTNNPTDDGDKRARVYLVPITDEKPDFTLADANGTKITVIDHTAEFTLNSTENGIPYFDLPTAGGEYALETIFKADTPTKIRIVVEKGAPDWSNINNSKMAAMGVAVSNVSLGYK